MKQIFKAGYRLNGVWLVVGSGKTIEEARKALRLKHNYDDPHIFGYKYEEGIYEENPSN